MRNTLHILLLGIFMLLFSCAKQGNEEKETTAVTATTTVIDTFQANIDKRDKEILERRKKLEEQYDMDSLRLVKVLSDALKIANQNIDKDTFRKVYEVISDSISIVKVEIDLGYNFTRVQPHLMIRRHSLNDIYIDIYSKSDTTFEKVVSHEQSMMTYTNDTIQDINGDGLKDFVVNWYGSSGCCLKAFSDVYLLRPDKKLFSSGFKFINPTFSPAENIIRGVCYGHTGETQMYKYKWAGEKVDTLEYVSYEKNDDGDKTGKVIVSTQRSPYWPNFKVLKRLNSVPNEYKRIEGYDWFTGEGYP